MTLGDKAWITIGAIEEILRQCERKAINKCEALEMIEARVKSATKELDDVN